MLDSAPEILTQATKAISFGDEANRRRFGRPS
jgi:hypothetical protein